MVHQPQKLSQSVLIIHFFSTAHERRVRLHANAIETKGPETAPMIPEIGPLRESRVTTLAEMVPHQQPVFISQDPAKASNVETRWVPLEIFEQRELQ